MARQGIDLTNLPSFNNSAISQFKAGMAEFATDHKLAYAGESLLPKNLNEVTDRTMYGKMYHKVVEFLNELGHGTVNYEYSPTDNAVNPGAGMEGFSITPMEDATIVGLKERLYELCQSCNIPDERIAATMESLALMLHRYSNNKLDEHFAIAQESLLPNLRSLSSIYPGSVTSEATYTGALMGAEMFGANIQQKTTDIKTAMTITLVKSYKGLTNRLMHRVSNDNGVVMFLVPNDEFYDLSKSNAKTSAERDSFTHRNQLITLLTHPEPVDMEMIPVYLQKSLDPDNKYLLADDVMLPNVECSLWDLSVVEGKAGYDRFNYTDLLSYSVKLRAIHLEIQSGEGDSAKKEQYVLNLSSFGAMTNFTHLNNTFDNVSDRGLQFYGRFPFDRGSETAESTHTEIFKNQSRSTEYVIGIMHFSASTNLQTTKTHGTGYMEFRPAVSVEGAQPSEDLMNFVKGLKATVIGWEIDARYSEENFRKTNMAVRAMSDVFTYTLPDGRTIVVDYSHRQTLSEHNLQIAAEVQTIGIDHRNLQIILKTLKATADRIRNERSDKRYIENYDNQTVSKAFVSGRRVHPTIAYKTIDMANVKVWRSSDMLSDHWTYMRACLNAITTEINYRSLLPQQLEDSPVKYKVLTTTPILDTIFSLASIHENQMPSGKDGEMVFDAKVPGKPVEFKTKLPNGVQLEFVTTVFHYVRDVLVLIPYRDNSPMDDLNFAVNFDGGVFNVQWTPTDGANMTIRRSMINTREYPIALCGIGAVINVINYDHLIPSMFELD